MSSPRISVLMPVFNCEQYICEAVDSVLKQTFSDFELLIIDDCSTDGTADVVERIKDPRIKLIRKPKNTGYTNSLNMGLEIARGEFVARMDGDDISLPTRFEEQQKIFESKPEVILCGTAMKILPHGEIMTFPTEHVEINSALLNGCCLAHPSVMFRRAPLMEHSLRYDPTLEPSEDFDLWTKMARVGSLYNLPQPLLIYRVHQQQVSEQRRTEQRAKARLIQANHLANITGLPEALLFFDTDRVRAERSQKRKIEMLEGLLRQVHALIHRNNQTQFFGEGEFASFLYQHKKEFIRISFLASHFYSPYLLWYCVSIYFKNPGYLSPTELLKTIVKCLIFWRRD